MLYPIVLLVIGTEMHVVSQYYTFSWCMSEWQGLPFARRAHLLGLDQNLGMLGRKKTHTCQANGNSGLRRARVRPPGHNFASVTGLWAE